jgi:hypothetical protein
MCKTNMKTNIYYVNICKHEHGKQKRLQCKIVPKINVQQIERMKGRTLIYNPLGI